MPHFPHLAAAVALAAHLLAAAAADAQGPVGTDIFSSGSCQTPARDDQQCGSVRWGWGDCPGGGRRTACDWCYGPDGVFAYVRRTNRSYSLSSGCDHLSQLPPGDVFWSAGDPDTRERMEQAGGTCVPQGRVYICQRVDPQRYRQAGRGGSGPSSPSQQQPAGDLPAGTPCNPNPGTGAVPGYDVIPIRRLQLLDGSDFQRDPGQYARRYEALTNGTFFGSPAPSTPVEPVGPMVINGQLRLRSNGQPSGFTPAGRGGIAVFPEPGREVVRVVRQPGRTLQDIQQSLPGVRDFMGGGALLIEDGRAVGTSDLFERQRFTNPARSGDPPRGTNQGLHAAQMNSALHTLVGMQNGQAYLLIPRRPKTGSQLQRDLCAQGFSDVVMFDGGHGFLYYRNGQPQPGTYRNLAGLTGLGVNPR